MSTPEWTAETLATWIERSTSENNHGYLEGAHQTCLLTGQSDLWNAVARILVDRGVIKIENRRWTSGLAEHQAAGGDDA